MFRTRYRIMIDVDVELEDATFERSLARAVERREDWIKREQSGEEHLAAEPTIPSEADVSAVRALQLELFRERGVLDEWLQRLVLEEAAEQMRDAAEATETARELLHPAVERLPPRARHWWRQAFYSEDDYMFERIDQLHDCLEMKARPIAVFEVERDP